MNIMFNDLSIDKQFDDADQFVDSLYYNTLPSMNIIPRNDVSLLIKSSNIYEKKIFNNTSLGEFISMGAFSYPELTMFKSNLIKLIDEPFWDEIPKSDKNAQYHTDFTDEFSGQEPNCFSEALERNYSILSLEHCAFKEYTINILKDGKNYELANFFDKESICEILFHKNKIGFSEYLLSKRYPLDIEFLKHNNKYYADSCLDNGEITTQDVGYILKDFIKHIEYLKNGTKSALSKSISHKNITYFEFRSKLSSSREFRLFYVRNQNKIIYLNSLLKKTQTTPSGVKDYSITLIKENNL